MASINQSPSSNEHGQTNSTLPPAVHHLELTPLSSIASHEDLKGSLADNAPYEPSNTTDRNGLYTPLGVDPLAPEKVAPITGRVISVVFCIPQSVTFSRCSGWKLESRRGNSALYDSLKYLSSPESSWDHTIVGWTGEIRVLSTETQRLSKTWRPTEAQGHCAGTGIGSSSHGIIFHEDLTISDGEMRDLEKLLEQHCGAHVVPVWLAGESDLAAGAARLRDQSRWRRYAEHELYTMLHYKQRDATDGQKEKLWWADYCRMNKLFADRVAEIYQPGDIVWIHDYQLLLLPLLLRQRLPGAYIGFFLHVSFPSSEYVRCLAQRKEILEGVLGADLVAFQCLGFSKHFASCCHRILQLELSGEGVEANGTQVTIDVIPIGIDGASAHRAAHENFLVDEKVRDLQELHAGKKIIFGRDRLDSVKGVVQKLQAFELFLERYPEWRGKVVLIQVTIPPNIVDKNEELASSKASRVSELVSHINGAFGSLSFVPVQYHPQYLSREEYFALLRVADVGLITSARDGMNTTSMQYVISQKDNHGPLILSEFSGTSSSLSSAFCINPWNLREVAECIHRALCMSKEERRLQHKNLYRQATTQTMQNWNRQFLNKLVSVGSASRASDRTPAMDMGVLTKRFRHAEKRIILLDYDGTLTPIVSDPKAAVPSADLVECISRLTENAQNVVWIISGRDQGFLETWLGNIPNLGLCAEHGSFIRNPMSRLWEDVTKQADLSWQEEVLEVLQHFTEQTPGSVIERKRVAITWHYRNADADYGRFQARKCEEALREIAAKKHEVDITKGKANVEVRLRCVNKGVIVKRLIEEGGGNQAGLGSPNFVLCLGDDHTDEDMFRALDASQLAAESVFTCMVGPGSNTTSARWHLAEPGDVIAMLQVLVRAKTG